MLGGPYYSKWKLISGSSIVDGSGWEEEALWFLIHHGLE